VSENIAQRLKRREVNRKSAPGGVLLGRLVEPTAASLKDWISSNVLLQLKGVPWDLGDGELLPIAGPCTTCPKRTGASAALFADLTTNEDTCVDPACFADKQKAFTLLQQVLAKEQGSPLLKISAKSSTEKLEKPVVEIRPSAVKVQGGKPVETKRAVVVATRPVKAGQWIAAKKGSCPSTVQAIAVDGPDQGKLRFVCADQSCKVHPRQVSKPQPRTDWKSMNQNSDENRAKREAEEKIREKVNEAIAAEILRADAKEAVGALILFIVEQGDGWAFDLPDLCIALDIQVPGYTVKDPRDWKAENQAREKAKPLFRKFIEEATLPELQDAARAILAMHGRDSYDERDLPMIAKMFDVDSKSIDKAVRAKLAAEAKAAEQAKPEKKKITAAEQKKRKASAAKQFGRAAAKARSIDKLAAGAEQAGV
jgi:ParB family chromosome partitioning protein